MNYDDLKKGWDDAAITNPNAAIHPSGNATEAEYNRSGSADTEYLMHVIDRHLKDDAYDFEEHGEKTGEGLTLLEYGCGNGRMTTHLQHYFKTVYAADLSYSMLQQLPRAENIIPVLTKENKITLPERVHMAVSLSVFIHNTYENGKAILRTISEHLMPGGYAFLQIPIYDKAKEPTTWTDVGVWTETMLTSAAKDAGFEVISVVTNEGAFSFEAVGPHHSAYQVLRKIKDK